MSTLNVHISWECHIYGPIQTCAPSLPFVIGKYFFCASPSFLSRLFSAAAHPNCMRVSAQWYGRCNFMTSTPLPLIVHLRAIFLIKCRSSLMSFWYCHTRVFLSGSRNDVWTVKSRVKRCCIQLFGIVPQKCRCTKVYTQMAWYTDVPSTIDCLFAQYITCNSVWECPEAIPFSHFNVAISGNQVGHVTEVRINHALKCIEGHTLSCFVFT